MINKIRNENQYQQVMSIIEGYIQKATEKGGFSSLSKDESEELAALSILAEQYEDNVLNIMPLPVSIPAMVQHKMAEMNINQAKLAQLLGLGTSKVSQILSGKREPDVPFLKAVHDQLGISAEFLLRYA